MALQKKLVPFKTAVSHFSGEHCGKGKTLRFRLVGQFLAIGPLNGGSDFLS